MLIARGNLCIKWVTDAHFAMQKRNFGLSDKSSFVVIKNKRAILEISKMALESYCI